MTLEEREATLAQKYGAYASFVTEAAPCDVDNGGESAFEEIERLLDRHAGPEKRLLDLGCGAGQTLCRWASRFAQVWGVEQQPDLLEAARLRVERERIGNATLVEGNAAEARDARPLPDGAFDIVLSQRGPNLTGGFAPKLAPHGILIQELVADQDCAKLKDIFGRNATVPTAGGDPEWLMGYYRGLELVAVSVKAYFYEEYFRDEAHLAAFLSQGANLSHWWLPECPYDPARDREALGLFCRYNRTERGIRLLRHRKVYVFRRGRVNFYPVEGDLSR